MAFGDVVMVRFANLVFVLLFAGSILVLAFVLNGHERFLSSMSRKVLFLGVPAVGIALAIVGFRLGPQMRILKGMMLIAVAAGCYAAEGFLTVRSGMPAAAEDHPPNFDTRTKYQVVAGMRAEGNRAYPSVFPAYFLETQIDGNLKSPLSIDERETLPLGGIANATTVLCNESGQYVTFLSDRHGFNNPDAVWENKNVQILSVGDSFAQGYCVSPPHHFMGRIQSEIPATVNLGISGNGPLMELASLLEYGPSLKPLTVLWVFFEGNDIQGNLSIEKRSTLLQAYLASDFRQDLIARKSRVDKQLRTLIDAKLESNPDRREVDAGTLQSIISFVGLSQLRQAILGRRTHGQPDYVLFEKIMKRAKTAVAQWDGQIQFVYLPSSYRVFEAPAEAMRELDRIRARVLRIVGDLNLPIIDIQNHISRHPDAAALFPFRRPGHYNEQGHGFVAEKILKSVRTAARSVDGFAGTR